MAQGRDDHGGIEDLFPDDAGAETSPEGSAARSDADPAATVASTDRRRRPAKKRRLSVVGVAGELLITAGVLVLMFLGWQLWLDDQLSAPRLKNEATGLSQQWDKDAQKPTAAPSQPASDISQNPPVQTAPKNAERFALLAIPRFGTDFYRPIAEGVSVSQVLNKYEVGHYPSTQMPGDIGNFVIASHRSAYGGALHRIHELEVGDHIFIETQDGWYQYSFRNLEYVKPTGVGVLDPVPQQDGVAATQRLLTLTTCNPFYSTAERIIGYSVFDKFTPRADGPPKEIAATVNGGS
ncbi:class E sortase [Schumannella soli]|uniref:Class E sortase n=1 Tax=Schumannella soli TaxID=2590779 RepID=A0A506Y758_9MICO|nr:class E sortase [Schumannella soli]TPW77855.1 class E sortase [Schumannella soli]